jgi:hypothetical protein
MTIPAGFDLLETDPESSYFDFAAGTAIPAGFFDPGSDAFTGRVPLAGVPLGTFGANRAGDADTVVHRLSSVNVPPAAPVPIEIVALNLVSVQPITVTYGGGSPEAWDVDITLAASPPSTGQLTITPTGPMGGTFSSQFAVHPVLTFTRISDATQRTLTPGFAEQFITGGTPPWRFGCVAPALRLPGVNDGFCPGLVPTPPAKSLVVHQGNPPAQHAVYPAQEALEHFVCYTVTQPPFASVPVHLADQFASRNANVLRRAELCNPAQKNAEPWFNHKAHLQCYVLAGPGIDQVRAVRNQLGSQRLLIGKPDRLCAPTEKRKLPNGSFVPIPPALTPDHFQCYGVQPAGPLQSPHPISQVDLRDQFGLRQGVDIGPPVRLCAPVEKIHNAVVTPIQHPVQHLVCYSITQPARRRDVEIRNQFEQQVLQTIRPVELCVPSVKGPP